MGNRVDFIFKSVQNVNSSLEQNEPKEQNRDITEESHIRIK